MRLEIKLTENTKEVYTFYFRDYTLYLNSYEYLEKPSVRHRKFTPKKSYYRLEPRKSNLEESQVELSDYIKSKALKSFASMIYVKKWSER